MANKKVSQAERVAAQIELIDFINKQKKRKQERKMEGFVEFDGDLIPVTRPSTEIQLAYLNGCSNAITIGTDMTIKDQDMIQMFEASRDFIFACCPFMRNSELMEELGCAEPFDVVAEILGVEGAMEFATSIKEEFDICNETAEITETVKN